MRNILNEIMRSYSDYKMRREHPIAYGILEARRKKLKAEQENSHDPIENPRPT